MPRKVTQYERKTLYTKLYGAKLTQIIKKAVYTIYDFFPPSGTPWWKILADAFFLRVSDDGGIAESQAC